MEFNDVGLWLHYLPFDLKKYVAALSKDYFFKKRCWSLEYVIFAIKNKDINYLFKDNLDFWKSLWCDNIDNYVPDISFEELKMSYIYIINQKNIDLDQLYNKYLKLCNSDFTESFINKLNAKKNNQLKMIIEHILNKNNNNDKNNDRKLNEELKKVSNQKLKLYYYEKYVTNNVNAVVLCNIIKNEIKNTNNNDNDKFIENINYIVSKGVNLHYVRNNIMEILMKGYESKDYNCHLKNNLILDFLYENGMFFIDATDIKVNKNFAFYILNKSLESNIFLFKDDNDKYMLFNYLVKVCYDSNLIEKFMLKYNIDINFEIKSDGVRRSYSFLYLVASWYGDWHGTFFSSSNIDDDEEKINIEKIIDLFLRKGANPNYVDNHGHTVINKVINFYIRTIQMFKRESVRAQYVERMRQNFILKFSYLINKFISYGYNINIKDNNGDTALSYAIKNENTDIVNILLQFKPTPNNIFNYSTAYLFKMFQCF